MNYSQIVSALNQLSVAELSKLNDEVITQVKVRRTIDAVSIKQTLRYGAVVKVNHPKAAGKTFTVNEIRRTKAVIVDNKSNQRIIAPISLIEVL